MQPTVDERERPWWTGAVQLVLEGFPERDDDGDDEDARAEPQTADDARTV